MGRSPAAVAACALALACDAPAPDPGPAGPVRELRLLVCGSEAAGRVVALGAAAWIRGADAASLTLFGVGRAESLGTDCRLAARRVDALEPDLALVAGAAGPAQQLAAAGVRVRELAPDDLNGVLRVHRELGGLLGRDTRAQILIAGMLDRISAVATRRDGRSRLRVAWLVEPADAPDRWLAVGATGILHELLELAGAENAFHDPAAARFAVDAAALAASDAELVLVASNLPEPAAPGAALPARRVSAELSRLPVLDPAPRVEELYARLYPGDA